MFRRPLFLSTSLLMLSFTFQNTTIALPGLDEEFDHFVRYGSPSSNFFSNITEEQDEETKQTLLNLQRQEKESGDWDEEGKEKLWKTWRSLAHKENIDQRLSLLYSNKLLDLEWHGETAIELAKKCHHYIQQNDNLNAGFATQLAYRGFSALQIHFAEPDYDHHKKLRAAPQAIALLEDLKSSTAKAGTVSELSIIDSPIRYFHEHDIPQARVCTLLTVAYGSYALEGLDTLHASRNICINGSKALDLYINGLKGSTTPQQRKHSHKQICNLGNDLPVRLMYSPLKSQFLADYGNAVKKSTHELARIYKDELEEINRDEKPAAWCSLANTLAHAYNAAGKNDKALKYFNDVVNLTLDEKWNNTELFTFVAKKQKEATNFILSIQKER
ncbi:MAG: hypothetical protein H0X26_03565 [Alphaproteobacteria bacterium]|nr:hypothetical protein [Alphaproteobacteria bacterium]